MQTSCCGVVLGMCASRRQWALIRQLRLYFVEVSLPARVSILGVLLLSGMLDEAGSAQLCLFVNVLAADRLCARPARIYRFR